MATQTSIATEATRSAAVQNTSDYTNGVSAHLASDWQKHNQTNLISTLWDIPAAATPPDQHDPDHNIPSTVLLRFLVTIGNTDYAVVVPGIPSGTFTGGGTYSGSPNAVAPQFTVQPQSGSFTQGSQVLLTAAVSGTPPVLLSWSKDGIALGVTSSNLFLSNFTEADAGQYVCIATNANGQTVSAIATLTLKTSTGEPVPTRPF
jgi:hypothetical protein